MTILDNEPFLTELTNMFTRNRNNGNSLYVTMKRYDGRTKPKPRSGKKESAAAGGDKKKEDPAIGGDKKDKEIEYKCLIRAKIGDEKISTIVQPKDINKFQLAYANLLKGNLYGLSKKRENN